MKSKAFGLSGSALKILALVFMTIDHIGYLLLPDFLILRMIGRLAMPIFAYMVAEGCRYTKNKMKYFFTMFGMAVLCQLGYYIGLRSLNMCILVTFSMSILVTYAAQWVRKKLCAASAVVLLAAVCGAFFVCEVLPMLLPGIYFAVDYGFWGVMLPVFIYLGRSKREKLLFAAIGLALITVSMDGGLAWVQWFSLFAVPVLALYDGTRGKHPMKYFFYLYFPLHLLLLYGIGCLLFL